MLCAAGMSPAAALPGCFGPLISDGVFAGWTGEGMIRLTDGRVVVLSGVRAVHADGWPVRPGTRLYFYAFSPKYDRYGRLRAQVTDTSGRWWQRDLLQNGRAVVDISTDRYECARALYAAGDASAPPRVFGADAVPGDSHFHIVRGTIRSASLKNGRVYLNFGENWRQDFTVTISPEDMKRFRRLHADPLTLAGQRVEVRGFVRTYHGPEVELANPYQLRVLAGAGECGKFDRTGWICRAEPVRGSENLR